MKSIVYQIGFHLLEIHYKSYSEPWYIRPWIEQIDEVIIFKALLSEDRVIVMNSRGYIMTIDIAKRQVLSHTHFLERNDEVRWDTFSHFLAPVLSPDKKNLAFSAEFAFMHPDEIGFVLVIYEIDSEKVTIHGTSQDLYPRLTSKFVGNDQVVVWIKGEYERESVEDESWYGNEPPMGFVLFDLKEKTYFHANLTRALYSGDESRCLLNQNGLVAIRIWSDFRKKKIEGKIHIGIPMMIFDLSERYSTFLDPVFWVSIDEIYQFLEEEGCIQKSDEDEDDFEDEYCATDITVLKQDLDALCSIRTVKKYFLFKGEDELEAFNKLSPRLYALAGHLSAWIVDGTWESSSNHVYFLSKKGEIAEIKLNSLLRSVSRIYLPKSLIQLPELNTISVSDNYLTIGNVDVLTNKLAYTKLWELPLAQAQFNKNLIGGELSSEQLTEVENPQERIGSHVRLTDKTEYEPDLIIEKGSLPIPIRGWDDASCKQALITLFEYVKSKPDLMTTGFPIAFHFPFEEEGEVYLLSTESAFRRWMDNDLMLLSAKVAESIIAWAIQSSKHVEMPARRAFLISFYQVAALMLRCHHQPLTLYFDYLILTICRENCGKEVPRLFEQCEWDETLIDLAIQAIGHGYLYEKAYLDIWRYEKLWKEDGLKEAVQGRFGAERFAKTLLQMARKFTPQDETPEHWQALKAEDVAHALDDNDAFDKEIKAALVRYCGLLPKEN